MSNDLPPDILGQIHQHLKLGGETKVVAASTEGVDQAEKVVAYLNRLFGADPVAIHALMCSPVPANKALAEDPDCVVTNPPVLPEGCYHLSLLGLVNGLMSTLGMPYVNLEFDGAPNVFGSQKLVGFTTSAEPEA